MKWIFWRKEKPQRVDFDNLHIIGFVDTNDMDTKKKKGRH